MFDINNTFPRLLPPEREQELKEQNIFYTKYSDFLLTFYYRIDDNTVGHLKAGHNHDLSVLLNRAYRIKEPEYGIFQLGDFLGKDDGGTRMMVLTTKEKRYGAGMILSNDARQKINELFPDGYYLIPSSIHEWMIIDRDTVDQTDIIRMIREINRDIVTKDEFLSDDLYEIRDGMLKKVEDKSFEGFEVLI